MSRQAFIEYAGRRYGLNSKTSIKKGVETLVRPKKHKTYTDAEFKELKDTQEMEEYQMDYKIYYLAAKSSLDLKLRELYSCLWGQCDPALQNKIKLDKQFDNVNDEQDVLTLTEIINTICSSSNTADYYPLKCMTANAKLHKFCQGKGVSTADYYHVFTMLLKSTENAGVKLQFTRHDKLLFRKYSVSLSTT